MNKSKPHYEKLVATLGNDKLPPSDKPRIEAAIGVYKKWVGELTEVKGTPAETLANRVDLLNKYRLYLDLEIIFDSPEDFLYRQKGQLKLDNSVIEEFLPFVAGSQIIPGLNDDLSVGPANCYAAAYFDATLAQQLHGSGLHIRTKDQDFSISQKLYLKASHKKDYSESAEAETYIAYMATEIKTNLDKTMFQEACATARDLKIAVPGAKYYLMAEWLDMKPLSTGPTDIEEVLLLRGAKRLDQNKRKDFAKSESRKKRRDFFNDYLVRHPFRLDVFKRWVEHIKKLMVNDTPEETNALEKGYF
jgi:hypothetical protein